MSKKTSKKAEKKDAPKNGPVNIGASVSRDGRDGIETAARKAGKTVAQFVRDAAFKAAKLTPEVRHAGRPKLAKE